MTTTKTTLLAILRDMTATMEILQMPRSRAEQTEKADAVYADLMFDHGMSAAEIAAEVPGVEIFAR